MSLLTVPNDEHFADKNVGDRTMTTYTGIKKYSITLGFSLLLMLLGQNNARALILPDVPLVVFSSVENNVLLTFDDSGSMRWGFSPDSVNAQRGARRGCSSTFNGMAYNPTIVYTPPSVRDYPGNMQATPANLPDADFNAAWINGYIGGTPVVGTNAVDLRTGYRPGWGMNAALTAHADATYTAPTGFVPGFASCDSAPLNTAQGAFYYVYDDTITGCSPQTTTTENNDTCYRRVQYSTAAYDATTGNGDWPAVQKTNFANWYSYYRIRNFTAKAAAGTAFRGFGTNVRIAGQHLNATSATAGPSSGITFTNTTSTNTTNVMKRFCDDPAPSSDALCTDLSTARTEFFTRLYNSPATGGTPLRAAMQRAGASFGASNTGNNSPYREVPGNASTTAAPNPELSCRKNFHILMTDGYWNNDTATVTNTDGTSRTLGDGVTGYTATNPYSDGWSGTLADHAFEYWASDLRSTLDNNIPHYIALGTGDPTLPWDTANQPWDHRNNPATWQHMQTFTIGMGVPGIRDPDNYFNLLLPAADGDWDELLSGGTGWPQPADNDATGANIDDLWHAAVNSRGAYFSARDPNTMVNAFNKIIGQITTISGSAAGLGASGGTTSGGTSIFQVAYDTGTWAGRLISRPVDAAGIPQAAAWEAGTAGINSQDYLDRKILTYNPTSSTGVGFQWANLSTSQQNALNTDPLGSPDTNGSARLDYLRGASINEGPATPPATNLGFRQRTCYDPSTVGASTVAGTRPAVTACTADRGKLGDIVDSSPVYVAKPDFGYPDTIESVPYSNFANDPLNTGSSSTRTPMVYVGANDGMLHGFRASDGREEIAYVPNFVYSNISTNNLSLLTSPYYTHRFYVDGTPTVGDAFFGGAWHTMLVGGLRKGGKGYYALDITNPSAFSEANAAQIVKWEFPNPANAPDLDMGFSYSQPAIVKMANGQWAAVFGNGYNSTGTGRAMIYVVNIADGTLIQKIDTAASGGGGAIVNGVATNGMGTPAVVDLNDDYVADYIYAGDLLGNMWRIDVRSSTPADWNLTANVLKLFTATDGATPTPAVQPITTKPSVGFHPLGYGGVMVYFGTGKFLENFDNVASGTQVTQSFYGIYDRGATGRPSEPSRREATIIGRGDLLAQTLTTETGTVTGSAGTFSRRNVTDNPIRWRLDRSSTTTHLGWYVNLTDNGEKQVTDSLLREGRIIFTTLSPGSDACSPDGTGWLMELDSTNGGRIDETLDLNGDGRFDALDNPGYTYGAAGAKSTVSGGLSSPIVLTNPDGPPPPGGPRYSETKLVVTSKGAVMSLKESGTPNAPEAWRQVK